MSDGGRLGAGRYLITAQRMALADHYRLQVPASKWFVAGLYYPLDYFWGPHNTRDGRTLALGAIEGALAEHFRLASHHPDFDVTVELWRERYVEEALQAEMKSFQESILGRAFR